MNNDLNFSIKYCIASEALEHNVQLMLDYFYGTFLFFFKLQSHWSTLAFIVWSDMRLSR